MSSLSRTSSSTAHSLSRYKRSGHRQPPSPISLERRRSRYSSKERTPSSSASPSYKTHLGRRRHTRSRSNSKSRWRSRSRSHNSYRKGVRINREKPAPSRCIGVFGLNTSTKQCQIREIFQKFGTIERIQMVTDGPTGFSRGFCFIYYKQIAAAHAARDNCSGMEIDDRRIRVDYSITDRPHSPNPRFFKGVPAKNFRKRDRGEQQYKKRHQSPVSYKRSYRHQSPVSYKRSYRDQSPVSYRRSYRHQSPVSYRKSDRHRYQRSRSFS